MWFHSVRCLARSRVCADWFCHGLRWCCAQRPWLTALFLHPVKVHRACGLVGMLLVYDLDAELGEGL